MDYQEIMMKVDALLFQISVRGDDVPRLLQARQELGKLAAALNSERPTAEA